MSGESFFASYKAHFFGGGGFDGDIAGGDVEDAGDGFLHVGNMGFDLRRFEAEGSVYINNGISLAGNEVFGPFQQDFAVDVFELGGSVGKMIADIAQAGSSQQRIADGMEQYIGIAVAQRTFVVGDFNPANHQISSFNQLMKINAVTYPHKTRINRQNKVLMRINRSLTDLPFV